MTTAALSTAEFWHTEIERFVTWTRSRLSEVLDAAGVRELWLQGEAFRYFRTCRDGGPLGFHVNAYKRNDFICYGEDHAGPQMVAEVKLYGLDFYTKNLTGYSDLRPYVQPADREQRFVFTAEHECHPKEGSILKDYRKLLNLDVPLRLLILLLDLRASPNPFGQAIQRVEFGARGTDVFRDDTLITRVWNVS